MNKAIIKSTLITSEYLLLVSTYH